VSGFTPQADCLPVRRCHQPLDGRALIANRQYYHPTGCFRCFQCRSELSNTFYKPKDVSQPLCGACARERLGPCYGCNGLLDMNYVVAGSRNYHKQCFRCTYCGRQLGSTYSEKAAGICCRDCANRPTPPPNVTVVTNRSGPYQSTTTTTTYTQPASSSYNQPVSYTRSIAQQQQLQPQTYAPPPLPPRNNPPPPTSSVSSGTRPKFCAMCGTPTASLPASARFCASCGSQLIA